MTIQRVLQGIDFEWDSEKAISNFEKHGVEFEAACDVFFDPFVVVLEDQVIEREHRQVLLGMTTSWQLLYVVHTERWNTVFRIISARPATRAERKRYENQ